MSCFQSEWVSCCGTVEEVIGGWRWSDRRQCWLPRVLSVNSAWKALGGVCFPAASTGGGGEEAAAGLWPPAVGSGLAALCSCSVGAEERRVAAFSGATSCLLWGPRASPCQKALEERLDSSCRAGVAAGALSWGVQLRNPLPGAAEVPVCQAGSAVLRQPCRCSL